MTPTNQGGPFVQSPLKPSDLFHTGIIVENLASTKDELSSLLGVKWGTQFENDVPIVLADGPKVLKFTFVFSLQGPHFIELIASIEGTLWTVTPPGHAHHLGYWSDDVPATSAALTARGAPMVANLGADDAQAPPTMGVYHQARNGLYIEVLDRSMQEMLLGTSQ
jgi:hypothetical protein